MGTFIRATTVTALGVVGAHRRRYRSRLACLAMVALLSVLGGTVAASPAAGQATDSDSGTRIVARKLESGRIEFGLQQRQGDGSWGNRQLLRVRFFPTTATAGRWQAPLTLQESQSGSWRPRPPGEPGPRCLLDGAAHTVDAVRLIILRGRR